LPCANLAPIASTPTARSPLSPRRTTSPLSPAGIFGSDENAMRANGGLTSARGKRNANASSIPGGIFG
jgi:hypothetical protein